MEADEEDEGGFGSVFEDGHWIWDDAESSLVFVSDLPPKIVETVQITTKAPTGTIEFQDDVDLLEQIRFRRRYQRKIKPGQPDIITLQDVKDVALFTAPVALLSPLLISILHSPTTERFLRALILYFAYYLQVAEEMGNRILDLEKKVRTPFCDALEGEYRENLQDLRVLVAKEYSTMLIGGSDVKKYHHMGPQKKRRSLSDKDARLFETLLRMAVQIVWLALARKSFNQIELEVNRMFKSDIFNCTEHTLKTGYISKMEKEEISVLFGNCLRKDKKLNTRSPLMNELFCHRQIDYRLLGLGITKIPHQSPRLAYLFLMVAAPEDYLKKNNEVLGIIGMPRSMFDTMLKPLPIATEVKSKVFAGSMSIASCQSSKTSSKSRKSQTQAGRIYPEIVLPLKESHRIEFPPSFPSEPESIPHINEVQHRRWQNRLRKLLHPR